MLSPSPFYQDLFQALNHGVWMSLALIVPSALGGVAIGIVTGVIRAFAPRWLRKIGDFYTALFRGTPLVVQLFVLYYGFPKLGDFVNLFASLPGLAGKGIYLSPYAAAVTGFMLCSGAYQSEYVRGALLSIRQGQVRAAQALGFSQWQTVAWIIVPQAARRALPGCGNEIIYLIKYSSLAYLVTCMELMGEGKVVASDTFRFTEVFIAVGAYYLAMVTLATFLLRWLEERFRIPGFGAR